MHSGPPGNYTRLTDVTPIGCELAQSFARLGSSVTQIEMAPRLMIREDEDAAAEVRASQAQPTYTLYRVSRPLGASCSRVGQPGLHDRPPVQGPMD